MKKFPCFLLLSALLLTLTACGGQSEGSAGTSYTVTLEGNPTTGYEWSMASCDDALLVSELVFTEDDHEEGATGVGGVYTCTVTAKKDTEPGEYHLSFAYCRPWDEMNTLEKVANVTIYVDEEGTLTGETEVMDLSEAIADEETQMGVFIDYQPVSNDCYAKNGALLYTAVYNMPVVTLPEDPDAEEAINGWFASSKNDFFASLSAYDAQAADAYDLWKEKGKGKWNNGLTKDSTGDTESSYYVTVTCTPTLENEKYLSFRIDQTAFFFGDERESTQTSGVTFSLTKGGKALALTDLYTEEVIPFINGRIEEDTGYPGNVTDGDWFFTDEGLVALDESGTETVISYGDLNAYLRK